VSKRAALAVLIVFILGGICDAATPVKPSDFTGTSWVMYGTTKSSAMKLRNISVSGMANVDFENDGTIYISGTEVTISGDYGFENGKLVINICESDISDLFYEYLIDALDDANLSDYVDSVDVELMTPKVANNVSYSGNTISLAIVLSAKAKVTIYYQDSNGDDKEFQSNSSFTINIKGDHPTARAASWASKWLVNSTASFIARRVKTSSPVTLDISIGELGLNQFEMIDTKAVMFDSIAQGDFCRIGNKVMFSGSNIDIDSIIQNLYMDNAPDNVDWVDVAMSEAMLTTSINNGKTISLTGTTKFELNIHFNDGTKDIYGAKGTLKLMGRGVPKP
jgi:hypothetical protein